MTKDTENQTPPRNKISLNYKIVKTAIGIRYDEKGNCDLCFKKSLRKRLTIIKENPKIADWWLKMEQTYSNKSIPRFDLRTNKSIEQMVELAKKPFRTIEDKHELSKKQTSLFDNLDMDFETDCFCKAN